MATGKKNFGQRQRKWQREKRCFQNPGGGVFLLTKNLTNIFPHADAPAAGGIIPYNITYLKKKSKFDQKSNFYFKNRSFEETALPKKISIF